MKNNILHIILILCICMFIGMGCDSGETLEEAAGDGVGEEKNDDDSDEFSGPGDYVIRWKLNNNSNDEKGSYNLTGSPDFSDSSPKEGSHFITFDGTYEIQTSSNYDIPNNAISISAWININSGSNPVAVEIAGVFIGYNGDSERFRGGILHGGQFAQLINTISVDTWYHMIMTWDGTTIKLYINGNTTPAGTESPSAARDISSIDDIAWTLGNKSGDENHWNGFVDDVIIYDRALSASEVSDIYNSY